MKHLFLARHHSYLPNKASNKQDIWYAEVISGFYWAFQNLDFYLLDTWKCKKWFKTTYSRHNDPTEHAVIMT